MLYFCRHATALNPDRVDRDDAATLAMRIVNLRSQRWRDMHGRSQRSDCPTGKSPKIPVQPLAKKYSA